MNRLALLVSAGFLTFTTIEQGTAADAAIDWKMAKGQTITVSAPTHPYVDSIKSSIPQFEELTGIKVVLEEASEQEYFKKILLDLSSGSPSTDVFMAVHFAIPQYAKGRWMEPLGSYLQDTKLTDNNWYDFADMAAKLTGKVALITGAGAGTGQACARLLAQEGARLVLAARRNERLGQLKREVDKLGIDAISVIGDANGFGGEAVHCTTNSRKLALHKHSLKNSALMESKLA